ncbi:MAG: O-antigen polymerase [Tsuneonella sp.]
MIFVILTIIYARHPACGIYHPVSIYLPFHALVFIIRPILSLVYHYDAIYKAVDFYPSRYDRATVLVASNLALIVFMWVSLKVGQSGMVWKQTQADLNARQRMRALFWIVAIPLGAFGVYATLWQWFFEASSGIMNVMDPRTGVRTLEGTNGYFLIAGATIGPIAVVCAYLYRFTLLSIAPFIGFALLRLGTGRRSDFIAAAVMFAMLYLYDKRRNWPDLRIVMLGLVAVVAFVMVVQDRGAEVREVFGIDGVNENRVGTDDDMKPFETMDYAMMEAMEYIVYVVPQRSGTYDYFANNLILFTEPIPRSLWKNKPYGSPVQFFNLSDYGHPIGMAISMPGVGWLSLGYLGVAIWSAFFAWFFGRLYRWLAQGPQSNIAVIVYSVALSSALFAFRDGTVDMILRLAASYYLAIVAMIVVIAVLRPELLRAPVSRAGALVRRAAGAQTKRVPRAQRKAVPADSPTDPNLRGTRGHVPRAWRRAT